MHRCDGIEVETGFGIAHAPQRAGIDPADDLRHLNGGLYPQTDGGDGNDLLIRCEDTDDLFRKDEQSQSCEEHHRRSDPDAGIDETICQ